MAVSHLPGARVACGGDTPRPTRCSPAFWLQAMIRQSLQRRSERQRPLAARRPGRRLRRAEAFSRSVGHPSGSDQAVSGHQSAQGRKRHRRHGLRHRTASANARSGAQAGQGRARLRSERDDGQPDARSSHVRGCSQILAKCWTGCGRPGHRPGRHRDGHDRRARLVLPSHSGLPCRGRTEERGHLRALARRGEPQDRRLDRRPALRADRARGAGTAVGECAARSAFTSPAIPSSTP